MISFIVITSIRATVDYYSVLSQCYVPSSTVTKTRCALVFMLTLMHYMLCSVMKVTSDKCRTARQRTFIRTRVHKPWKTKTHQTTASSRAWFNYDRRLVRRRIRFESVSRFSKQMRTWGWTPRENVHYLVRPLEWISHVRIVVASAEQDKRGVTVWECLRVCVCVSKCVNEEDLIQAPLHAHLT